MGENILRNNCDAREKKTTNTTMKTLGLKSCLPNNLPLHIKLMLIFNYTNLDLNVMRMAIDIVILIIINNGKRQLQKS